MTSRLIRLALLVILLAAAGTACTSNSTPPGANKYLGFFEQGGYLFADLVLPNSTLRSNLRWTTLHPMI